MHVGIHSSLAEDAIIDGKTAATGGVTAAIACFRTGRYYLNNGYIRVGYDADCIMPDPDEPFTARAAEGCAPFESMELTRRVNSTGLRGALAFDDGDIAGGAIGKYLSRRSARPR